MRRDRIICRILSDAGYPVGPEQVHLAYTRVESTWLGLYAEKSMTGPETEKAYQRLDAMIIGDLFPRTTKDEVGELSLLTRQRWPEVQKTVPLELYPDAIPTLERLRSDGYKLGIVSNAPPDTRKVIDSLGLPQYLPVIVVSGVVGFSKPNPEIFKIALSEVGAEPSETLHIGDLYEADVIGARNAGIRGVLIDRDGSQARDDCPTIASLGEVYRFLE
ncbi:MAG: HAD-IA family hydrolase [Thaumarchaeota archaeon]|nr:HAD-IA family hydrolase [Nitrososphaerota archaeon]